MPCNPGPRKSELKWLSALRPRPHPKTKASSQDLNVVTFIGLSVEIRLRLSGIAAFAVYLSFTYTEGPCSENWSTVGSRVLGNGLESNLALQHFITLLSQSICIAVAPSAPCR